MSRPPITRLRKRELQRLFNRELLPLVLCGHLDENIAKEGEPKPSVKAEEPLGTRSQLVEYFERPASNQPACATVHRYLRPDGKIGQSGLPDPKRLIIDGQWFAMHPEPPA